MEKESPRYRLVKANSTGGLGSQRTLETGGGGGYFSITASFHTHLCPESEFLPESF